MPQSKMDWQRVQKRTAALRSSLRKKAILASGFKATHRKRVRQLVDSSLAYIEAFKESLDALCKCRRIWHCPRARAAIVLDEWSAVVNETAATLDANSTKDMTNTFMRESKIYTDILTFLGPTFEQNACLVKITHLSGF